jgi:acetyl esterase/lipase
VLARIIGAIVASLAVSAAGMAEPVVIDRDIAYRAIPGVDPHLLSLDVYTPANRRGAMPVMVMVHGGSFVHGDKAGQPGVARPPLLYPKMEYYTARGWVFVSINYRLTDRALPAGHARQVRHPDHIEDVAAAFAWLHANVARFGGDKRRIVLVGHSAGATLVALLATDGRRLAAHALALGDIAAVIALDGYYDVEKRMPRAAPFMPLVFGDDPAAWRDASPQFHVAPGKKIPPMLIVYNTTGRDQDPALQSRAFAAQLRAAGADATAYEARGKTHADIGEGLGMPGDPLSDTVDAFLARVLR